MESNRQLALTIDGMSCNHCVAAVTSALKSVDGVTVDDVRIGAATLRYDPARTSVGKIVDAVQDEGYSASATQ